MAIGEIFPVTDADRVDALYALTLDGTYASSGDVESPSGWFALVSDEDEWFIVRQVEDGERQAVRYASQDEAREAYADLDRAYSRWIEYDDPYDYGDEYDTSDYYDKEYDLP